MGLQDVTQTGLEIELGGKKYHMSPLDDQDHADLDSWVQSRFIANAYRAAKDFERNDFERLVSLAMKESLGLSWLFDPGKRVLRTIEGYATLAWYSVRHRHPDVTFEVVRSALFDARTLEYFKMMFNRVNNPELSELERKKTQEAANGKLNPIPVESSSTSGSPT